MDRFHELPTLQKANGVVVEPSPLAYDLSIRPATDRTFGQAGQIELDVGPVHVAPSADLKPVIGSLECLAVVVARQPTISKVNLLKILEH